MTALMRESKVIECWCVGMLLVLLRLKQTHLLNHHRLQLLSRHQPTLSNYARLIGCSLMDGGPGNVQRLTLHNFQV